VTPPWLVAGLGNPGAGYAGTRHNAGYLVADLLAERLGGSWKRHRTGRADTAAGRLGAPGTDSPRIVVVRARSYMNESGGAVSAVATYEGVQPANLVAVHDELDLPFGVLRVKLGGGDNGHNGLRSLRSALGTGAFHRVRVGIGRPLGRQSPHDFVLSAWSASERRELELLVARGADAVEALLTDGLERAQNMFNR
jgi:peptidyl-tRNA hydrolase, PTH1 family